MLLLASVLSLSLFLSFSLFLPVRSTSLLSGRSKERRRWRLITTQSPLPVRPGLRPVPRKQQPPFAALGHSPPRYRCCKTNNLRPLPRKKEHCPSPPPGRPFSPNHRRADRSSDYWHPENPSPRIARDSTLARPIEGRGKHALKARARERSQRYPVDTTLCPECEWSKRSIFGIIPPYE